MGKEERREGRSGRETKNISTGCKKKKRRCRVWACPGLFRGAVSVVCASSWWFGRFRSMRSFMLFWCHEFTFIRV